MKAGLNLNLNFVVVACFHPSSGFPKSIETQWCMNLSIQKNDGTSFCERLWWNSREKFKISSTIHQLEIFLVSIWTWTYLPIWLFKTQHCIWVICPYSIPGSPIPLIYKIVVLDKIAQIRKLALFLLSLSLSFGSANPVCGHLVTHAQVSWWVPFNEQRERTCQSTCLDRPFTI